MPLVASAARRGWADFEGKGCWARLAPVPLGARDTFSVLHSFPAPTKAFSRLVARLGWKADCAILEAEDTITLHEGHFFVIGAHHVLEFRRGGETVRLDPHDDPRIASAWHSPYQIVIGLDGTSVRLRPEGRVFIAAPLTSG